ncbi:uncharacterized protein LOC107777740 [Nicotiana tabacum]|uniref:Structure-specific endonuclease subunit SLX1 homolog n=2 Tax=Nicotiana TaxID=4085 RepID=A0A1S3YM43_TOBAC|nr:PREDICTED: structure-specific endonuclease subunit SLX1 homolog [Nicotiana sylvestris]XP_016453356.1 PREDICTED: structure-specific endonuclease subunit SLX1 homolog [Nicotiana tabacum]
MARPLSTIFKSTKPHILKPQKPTNFESLKSANLKITSSSNPIAFSSSSSKLKKTRKCDAANSQLSSSSNPLGNGSEISTSCKLPASHSTESNNNSRKCKKIKSLWCVYLILSTNPPIKTYVGVTTNFSRRLKQHNGEIKGGAKASRSGRPWICACLIRGFEGRSEACAFESKWKQVSRRLPRKRKTTEEQKPEDNGSSVLLQHRHAALNRVQCLIDCSHLNIDWKSNISDLIS